MKPPTPVLPVAIGPPPPRRMRASTLAGVLVTLALAAVLMAMVWRAVLPRHEPKESRARVESIGNIKQIALALYEFEREYGSYPNAETIETVRKNTGTDLPLGTRTANDFFRQLIAAKCLDNESIFSATIPGSRRPDRNMHGAHALEKGECGFSYIIGPNSSADPPRPLIVTPLIPGTNRFDPKPFRGKAVILWTDNSATVEIIDPHGQVFEASDKSLLDPANPLWGGKPPVIAWPE